MTRFPHDQFAKDFLESLLSPLGQVQTSLKISGEVREMDVYFTPDANAPTSDLGLLSQCASTAVVFEPYRSSVNQCDRSRSMVGYLNITQSLNRRSS